mgnify:CR=1 FL=1
MQAKEPHSATSQAQRVEPPRPAEAVMAGVGSSGTSYWEQFSYLADAYDRAVIEALFGGESM